EGPITRGRKDRRSPTRRSKSKGPDAREHVETRLANLEQSLEDVQHTVEELGDNYEELIQENVEISAATKELVADLGKTFQKDLKELSSTVTTLKTFVEGELRELYSRYISLDAKVDTLCMECRSKHFGGDGPSTSTHTAVQGTTHIKVPKPDTYNGVRNATVVENFLFGLDRYYVAVGVRDDEAKINNAPTFLRDAAQLWWRRRYADQNGNAIQTWEQFKAELRKHFVPHNAEMESRAKLRSLRHTGNILDYVKEFTTIMLEISDLPEKEALFQFRDGLKDWAKVELDRRNAATKMKKWADRKRRAREYQVGEKVMVKLLPNQFKSLRKVHKGLIRRYEGPFSIIEKVGKAAYRLELPPRLKIHNVFHVSMLKPFYEDKEDPSRGESSRAPTGMISEFDRKIKEILAERKIRRRGVPSYNEYLIAWEGLPESEASWEKEDTLWQFQDEIRRFQESATGTLRNRNHA
ncbi:hypothetical protein Csa_019871, partial [Cucumis sativus]